MASCDVACHVMSLDVLVTSRDAMRCHVMRAHVNSGTTKYYSSTALYYKELLQSYSKHYSSTTPYYKVLQRTTPLLLRFYKVLLQYYSNTTPYYRVLLQYCKVLLQYYSVLQSTSAVLLRTTKYYSSATLYYKVLLCTTKYYSSTTLYHKVLLQY